MKQRVMLVAGAVLLVLLSCDAPPFAPEPGRDRPGSILDEGSLAGLTDDSADHDPRAFVFEDLGPPGEILEELEGGECVLHYRRPNGKYTPFPYRLSFSEEAEAVEEPGEPARLIFRGRGWGEIRVRALCRFPASKRALAEAKEQLRRG